MKLTEKRFSSDDLKIVAIVTMILNHFCYSYYSNLYTESYFFSTAHWYLSRLSFVLYCFFIAEGMVKTHDRKKYLSRLFAFAFISEIPFDLCFERTLFDFDSQNVFFTLFLGALSIEIYDRYKKRKICGILFVLILGLLCEYIGADYGYLGVFLIFVFYISKGKKAELLICALAYSLMLLFRKITVYIPYFGILQWETIALNVMRSWALDMHGLLAFPLIYLYNGERGKIKHRIFFYLVYPVHLIIIYFIISLLIK